MYRKIRCSPTRPDADAAFAVAVCQSQSPPSIGRAPLDRAVARAAKRPEFKADRGETKLVDPAEGGGRAILIGLGDAKKLDHEAWRRAAAAAVRTAHAARLTRLHWVGKPAATAARAIGDGAALANFDFADFHGQVREPDRPIDLTLSIDGGKTAAAQLREALTIGEAVTTTRSLAATPPNVANPAYITRFCRNLARKVGLRCTVIDKAKAKQLNMGGLLAVGSGGSTPPAMIVLEWSPQTSAKKKPVLLVGKAVTFDTGGYSLKPGGGKNMKYDKCGGMAVVGVMEAAAKLKLKQHVVGLIPCVENMIDSTAYRVDDIITFTNGVTCEVTNTDAEGRLILADALAYGAKRYKPRAVIDLATLTGGVVTALGPWQAGLFANDDKLADQLIDAGQTTGESLWRLPLTDELRNFMKGTHGDLINANEKRYAHPGQGAAFLSFFVGQDAPKQMPTTPWAHLDIAAVADTDGSVGFLPKGPTGFGVRLLVHWLAGR